MPVSGIRPAAIRASSSRWFRVRTSSVVPWPWASSVAMSERSFVIWSRSSSCWRWSSVAVSTSGVRSWVVYRTRGPCAASWAAMRKPRARSANPSVICQLGIARSAAGELGHGWGWSGGRVSGDSAGAGAGGGGGGAGRAHGSSGGGASAEASLGRVHGTDPGGSGRGA